MTILCALFQNCFPLVPLGLKRKFITLRSKFKTVPSLKHLKSQSGRTDHPPPPFQISHVTDWVANGLGRDSSGDAGGGASVHFPSSFIYLSSEWNSSSVARERCTMRESWSCWMTEDEWKTSVWPDQGRKTHVLLVLVVWLPAERVGNSSSGRDGETEGWKRWRRRRWGHVCGALTLTWKGCKHIVLFVRWRRYLVGKGWIIKDES